MPTGTHIPDQEVETKDGGRESKGPKPPLSGSPPGIFAVGQPGDIRAILPGRQVGPQIRVIFADVQVRPNSLQGYADMPWGTP